MKGFWHWFWIDSHSGPPGWRRYLNWWLVGHLLLGVTLTLIVPIQLSQAANTVLLPLAGLFIGLAFAWGGNAQALLQTDEITELTEHHPGGFDEYIFTFQAAILVIMITISLWGIAGLGVYDLHLTCGNLKWAYSALSIGLYSLISLTLRECWHVVVGAQDLLRARHQIRKQRREASNPDNSACDS